jgi:signal peptidase I
MAPTYDDGSFNLCWRGRYLWSEPQRGDIVVLRFAGERELLLKRVLALAGDTIAFRDDTLLVNGALVTEPYVHGQSSWNFEPRRVESGKVFVAGDNRAVPMERYHFGQIDQERIMGGLVW